jgi:signal transduction histidine kinase
VTHNNNTDNLNGNGVGVNLPFKGQETAKGPDMVKMIHDFRSCLNVIAGYSEIMLDDEMGKMTEEQRVSLKDILNKSHQMADIVNDFVLWLQLQQK